MSTLSYVIQQLPYLLPMQLVYVAGVILAFVHFKDHAKPATFALIGCSMMFVINGVFPFIQGFILMSREQRGWGNVEYQRLMLAVGVGRTLLQVCAFSLVLAAIFVGRNVPIVAEYKGKSAFPE